MIAFVYALISSTMNIHEIKIVMNPSIVVHFQNYQLMGTHLNYLELTSPWIILGNFRSRFTYACFEKRLRWTYFNNKTWAPCCSTLLVTMKWPKKRVYIWKLCFIYIYIYIYISQLPSKERFNQSPMFLIHWNFGSS